VRRKRAPARPEDWLTRLDDVRETGDRRASAALLAAFLAPETGDDRRTDVAVALRALEDVRCAEPLRRAVLDTELAPDLRSLALEIHAAIPVDAASRAEALEWARSSDVVVRAFGVRLLDVPDGEALAAASNDPEPLVRYAAMDAITSIARTTPLVDAARRALADEDAAIREAACRVALFDEPIGVTHDLLRALGDPSAAVRVAASDALEDFPRVSVLLALAEARGKSESGLAAELAFEAIVRRIREAMDDACAAARRRLERWCEPVRWLLEERAAESEGVSALEQAIEDLDADGAGYERVDPEAAAAVLFDDDAPPSVQRRMLVFRSWEDAGDTGRYVLRRCAASPNWSIRQGAALALAELRSADDVVPLTSDREPVVRRAAFEGLRRLEDVRGVAPARETLADPELRPTAGDEAMALVVELARPAEAERMVVEELSRDDDRDGLWLGAIHLARHAEIEAAVPALRRIAEGPVTSSVLPHVAALAALRDLGRSARGLDLSHLEALDHLEVQRELGEWGWRGARYG
jgi:HEAT repeat protein